MSAKREANGKSPSVEGGGSAVDLDSPEFKKVLEKVDKESAHRELGGWQKIAISIIALAFSVFHIYTGLFGQLDAHLQRAVHLAFVLTLVYLLYPASKKMRRDRLNPVDLLFVALSLACLGYLRDPSRTQEASRAARRLAERFSLEACVKDTLQLYEELLSRTGAHP